MGTRIPDNIHLRAACGKAVADANGEAEVLIRCMTDRMVHGGIGWTEPASPEARVRVSVKDVDNLLGGGAGMEVGNYYDDEQPEPNQGYYIGRDTLAIDPIANVANAPAGMYLSIKCTGMNQGETFYCNIKWGKKI